ncbi:hypothetical protein ACNFJN_15650 [Xenorhabdus budapestensis]|uniref:hypothetical protein n=1 Tax=Xenorhabdus budapestensis TaxID=290110 RepID=UPI003A8B3A64
MNNSLVPPFLPQSSNGIIDVSKLNQSVLEVFIDRYESVHIGDNIVVHLNDISSEPYYIRTENIDYPKYEIEILLSSIPLDSYDVFYTITDIVDNTSRSEITLVTIENSDTSLPPPLEAALIITGYQQIGDEYVILTIQVHDKQTSEQIKNTVVSYKIDQAVNISSVLEINGDPETIQPMTTDEYGQFKINLKGQKGGACIIRVTANNHVGNIKYIMGQN